jgi:hypothetical protein
VPKDLAHTLIVCRHGKRGSRALLVYRGHRRRGDMCLRKLSDKTRGL